MLVRINSFILKTIFLFVNSKSCTGLISFFVGEFTSSSMCCIVCVFERAIEFLVGIVYKMTIVFCLFHFSDLIRDFSGDGKNVFFCNNCYCAIQ